MHQGKDVVSRTAASVAREVRGLAAAKSFNGVISDLGGPTANMFHMRCMSAEANAVCRRVSCLHPVRCKHYGTDQRPYVDLLRQVRAIPGVKRVFVNSGLRYDLAALDDTIVEEIATHHVSGTLTTAPEHVSPTALQWMRKPPITDFRAFMDRFKAASADAGKQQLIVPYFQCGHPGTGPEEAIELALYMKRNGLRCRQVQLFMPTPGTLATAMYLSGHDPYTKRPLPVARGHKERARQRSMLFWWKREEWPAIREALLAWAAAISSATIATRSSRRGPRAEAGCATATAPRPPGPPRAWSSSAPPPRKWPRPRGKVP